MEKGALRRQLLDLTPGPGVAAAVVEGLFDWMSSRLPGTVAAYLALGMEIDVEPLFGRLPGWRWVLPRVEEDRTLTFRDRSVPIEIHPYGMRQPSAAGVAVPLHEIDLLLVPGLGFDRSGGRLGRGAGYYDGILARRRPDCLAIGVTWSDRVLPAVPMADHDQPVDYLATESGVSPCRATLQ